VVPDSRETSESATSPLPADFPERVECIAYSVGRKRYRAICLDFSLVAESTVSVFDAQERLVELILDYIADVIGEGCPPHLVKRRLTFLERLPLRLMMVGFEFIGAFCALLNRGPERAVWCQPISCPA